MTKSTYLNGKITNYTYDTLNRTKTINAGTSIFVPTYTYNDASDILGDATKSYTYDGYARLIGATAIAGGTSKEIINLDKSGNRTSYTLNTYTVNSATNTLDQYTNFTGGETSTYTYDSNGNLKTIGTKVFTYDYNNRLIQYTIGASIRVKYLYDTLGRRIEKIDYSKSTTNPESTLYIYNGDNIQSEYMTTSILVNGTGTLTRITLKKNYLNSIGTDAVLAYDAEQQVNPTSTGKTTTRYYYHMNQLGSIIAISTSTGQVIQKYTYNAYGKPYIYSGSTLTPLSNYTGTLYSNTRLYTGREYDRETGYYYLRARTYSPDLGRFLSRDPVGQNDQVNLYTYVKNSPLNYTDRNGKNSKPLSRKHDATALFYSDLNDGLSSGLTSILHNTASKNGKFNIKYRTDYQELSFDRVTNESCVGRNSFGDCVVYIEDSLVELADLGNFLIGVNFASEGFTLDSEGGLFYNDINQAGLFTEDRIIRKNINGNNALFYDSLEDEYADRPWYAAGYNFYNDRMSESIEAVCNKPSYYFP